MFYIFDFKKYRSFIARFLVLFVVVILGLKTFNFLFPLKHFNLINEYAAKYNLAPSLICSVIHTESKFKEDALSSKGASGLMQIRKSTADWGAQELNLQNYSYDDIFEPKVNIEIGCWYINKLLKQFNGSTELMLCAYNAGSGNVSNWLKNPQYSSDGKTLFNVPFPETRKYVRKVQRNQKVYKLLIDFITFIEED